MSQFVTELSAADFVAKVADKSANLGLVLVDFWAPWCQPCLSLAPYVEQLAEKYQGKLTVYKVNVQTYRELALQNNIRNIPTLHLFKDGTLLDRRIGGLTNDDLGELEAFVQPHLA